MTVRGKLFISFKQFSIFEISLVFVSIVMVVIFNKLIKILIYFSNKETTIFHERQVILLCQFTFNK